MQTCLSRPPLETSERATLRAIIAGSSTRSAFLALQGDKRLLFSPSGRAFVMYDVIGRSWIALGDPVGPEEEHAGLARDFTETCLRQGGRPVFYRVAEASLATYAGLGLAALKMGEEARVALTRGGASLDGGHRRNLRQTSNRAAREGCGFEIVEPDRLHTLLPELHAISSAWLRDKPTREKRFSLGVFETGYLCNFPVAVVRRHGCPVAFASIWLIGDGGEIEVDLMRLDPQAPYGTMDFLLTRLMQWGAAHGYATLNLGLSPLAGFDYAGLPPAWRMLARFGASQAGRFYNFAGLRQFKAKFSPEWRPRYLLAPGGLALPLAILDSARLVAGGYRGLIGK